MSVAISDLALPVLFGVGAAFVLAGFVKGVVGLGLPTVSMGLLGSFMPPAQAAVLLLLPSVVTNVWQLFGGPALGAALRRLWTLQAGVLVGTVCAPVGLADLDPRVGALGLGAALLVYAVCGLASVRVATPLRWQRWASPCVGLATGCITAATGVFVFPAVPYIQGLGLGKEALVQALGLSFLFATVALWLRLGLDGALPALASAGAGALPLLVAPLIALLAALAGMAVGQWLRTRLSEALFKRVFFVGMALLALYLLAKGLATG